MHSLVFPLLCHEPFISSRCHYPPLRSKSERFLCLCCGSAVDPTTMGSNLEFTAQRRDDITLTRDPPGGPSPCFPERERGVGPSVHWPWSPYVEWSTPVCWSANHSNHVATPHIKERKEVQLTLQGWGDWVRSTKSGTDLSGSKS